MKITQSCSCNFFNPTWRGLFCNIWWERGHVAPFPKTQKNDDVSQKLWTLNMTEVFGKTSVMFSVKIRCGDVTVMSLWRHNAILRTCFHNSKHHLQIFYDHTSKYSFAAYFHTEYEKFFAKLWSNQLFLMFNSKVMASHSFWRHVSVEYWKMTS